MLLKSAEINQAGVEALLAYANKPTRMGAGGETAGQRYIPGISVPGMAGLEEFSIPIQGDEEPVSLTIDWPRTLVDDHDPKLAVVTQRVIYTGHLPAEDVFPGTFTKAPKGEDLDDIYVPNPADDAFDDFTGEWGGFLQATGMEVTDWTDYDRGDPASKPILTLRGAARFLIFESAEEWRTVVDALDTGLVSAADVVNTAMIYPQLAQQLGNISVHSV